MVSPTSRPSLVLAHNNLVSASVLLQHALSSHTAVMAFNFTNMEILKGIVAAANEMKCPVILQASASAISYMGMDYLVALVSSAAATSGVPLALHLDHGSSFEICKLCIDSGFTSVMIDASSLDFESNIATTRNVVEYAKEYGVSVEAELGTLFGVEDEVNISLGKARYTDPDEAAIFIERTGIDSLAVAIGTSHGPNKGLRESPSLSIDRLKQIKAKVGEFPLVLHGASSVYEDAVELCNAYGADIKNAHGIKDSDILEAVRNGIAKINVDTDLRIAFTGALRKHLHENRSVIDMRQYLGEATKAVQAVVTRKLSAVAG